ncbi:MAG TPA: heme-dependent oxidative N-demethylase subunit alpha family protein [Ramlibacter sp.]|uniref:heme-dependent oxidative N-demethylase subunit alpha family protein n=1 Tax=Ramlibacter sp. TaxID=1917967 RepID=UPI002BF73457|nr:heme-dependent oxidative N-demethylase subunit alpha family protein [Ramlibacter sp.]HVZ44426.1 heme-dependent oxidative N-demethylase subunit alpha family protein [Ramlibacter sp.]
MPGTDFSLIAAPFRMQPGLRKVAPGTPQLTALARGAPLWQEKREVVESGASRLAVPGFDAAPAMAAIAAHARHHGLPQPDDESPLELTYEEDFAVLDGSTGTLPWLCVCVPSHWAPEDKLGLPFAAVHAPVADADTLRAASQHLVRIATGGDAWERFVWTLTPSARYDQHPRRHPREPWPATADLNAFARGTWLRTERQTFIPVPSANQAVFTIRVMLEPLGQAVDSREKARRLGESLASMSDAVLAYKGLAAAREALVRWLAQWPSQ